MTRTSNPLDNMHHSEPTNIGSRRELFIDDGLIDQLGGGASRRMHHPQPREIVLNHNAPWEGNGCGYHSLFKDGDLYRLYYKAWKIRLKPGKVASEKIPDIFTCYAESRDGKIWTKPELGQVVFDGNEANNIVLDRNSLTRVEGDPGHPAIFRDENPSAKTRYKGFIRSRGDLGLIAIESDDGFKWSEMADKPVITSADFAFDSQNVAFWSEAEACYVCYFRTWETPHGRLRTISRTTSTDFLNWSKPAPMHPNLPGEHLYTNQTHPYFRAPHLYVALPTRFMHGKIRGQAVKGNIGSTDILFMTSRAGTTSYERLFTEAFIRPGLDPERWGNRSNYAALNVVPTGEAEMSIYHQKSGHRYVLRTDGFISIQAGAAPGELGTKPLRFRGSRLVLNYSTSAAGSVQVEIQDTTGNPLPGFRLADCQPLVGDQIAGTVGWQAAPDLGALAGQPVRLRFVMTECDLYSFRFADE